MKKEYVILILSGIIVLGIAFFILKKVKDKKQVVTTDTTGTVTK